MTFEELKQEDQNYILGTYGRFDLCLVEGKGCRAKDPEGNSYLDFTSGIGVNSLGWCDDEWLAAITKQAGTLQHTSNLFYTEPGVKLAKTLCERTGMSKVFFSNSGAESNEGAIKAARKYSFDKYGEGRGTILSILNSFHGRTIGALTATGQVDLQKGFAPLTPGFKYIPGNDATVLASALSQDVCALMIEPIQGEGGVNSFDADYLEMVESVCKTRDVLIIADEIQTGLGRTGSFLASQMLGFHPDIVSLAKGLGGGLPIGAILFNEKCAAALGKGTHGSTFGMNLVACAGANVVMDRLTDDFMAEVAKRGKVLKQCLQDLPHVADVTGAGLMVGVRFDAPVTAAAVREAAQKKGLLCLLAKDKLRLLPPLVISEEEIMEGISILRSVLETIA